MKTQINSLQRGNHTQGIVGTSHEIRERIAAAVVSENPEYMDVKVKGHEYHLTACTSLSGKTTSYISEQLTVDQVRDIIPYDIKAIEHPELVSVRFSIKADMTCEYVTFRRVKTTRQWKAGQTIAVEEKNVTIL